MTGYFDSDTLLTYALLVHVNKNIQEEKITIARSVLAQNVFLAAALQN